MSSVVKDVIVIGSGPAGLTAAIYTARARLDTVVLAGVEYGGQLMNTTLVENYPGFEKGIMGPELMMAMVKQVQNQGAELVYKYADKVDFSGEMKKVWADGVEYSAKGVILAVGSSPRRLGIPGEDKFYGHGISTCATCDAAFFKDKVVAVVGGGDTAMEDSTFITKFAQKVYLIHRRSEFRASAAMQERALGNEKIEVLWDTEVSEVLGTDRVSGLKIENNKTGESRELPVDGMFLAIGHVPNTQFLQGHVELDVAGYIKPYNVTETSVEGVFVAGDVSDFYYQQAVTAAGEGCKAAMDLERWL